MALVPNETGEGLRKRDAPKDVMKFHCAVCQVEISFRSAMKTQLCSEHGTSRVAFLQQAGSIAVNVKGGGDGDCDEPNEPEKKTTMKQQLERMEVDNNPQFVLLLQGFCAECPNPGRQGKPRKQFDFSRVVSSHESGRRNETSADLVPMCKAEYIAWFTEQCPPYCRLSKVSAEQKWSKDFLDQRVQRDQVMCNDLDGNSMGWAWRLWIKKVGQTGERKQDIVYEDRSVRKEDSHESKGPTQKQHERLLSAAQELRGDLDEEECSLLTSTSFQPNLDGHKSVPEQPKPKAKPKGGKASVLVVASRAKKDTVKSFTQARHLAAHAQEKAMALLQEAKAVYGEDKASLDADPQVATIKNRLSCLETLMDPEVAMSDAEKGKSILERLQRDSFFADQCWDASHVHTLGQMTFVRDTMLSLQRTPDAVQSLAQQHKDSIQVLSTVAQAVTKECVEWKANVTALAKARDAEEKALQAQLKKQADKEKREALREEQKLAKAKAKQIEKEKKAAAAEARKAAQAQTPPNPEEPQPQDPRRRRKRVDAEIGEQDPTLVQAVADKTWPSSCELALHESPEKLAQFIAASAGMVAGVARCRKTALKKVMEASPGFAADSITSVAKFLAKEITKFGADFASKLEAGGVVERQSRVVEAPPYVLGMDAVIQHECDSQEQVSLQFMDRDALLNQLRSHPSCPQDADAFQKLHSKFTGVSICGSKQGSYFAGFAPCGMPAVYYQMAGERTIAVIDIAEAEQWCRDSACESLETIEQQQAAQSEPISVKQIVDFVTHHWTGDLPSLASLKGGKLLVGDVLFVPACSLLVEKSTKTHNIYVRALGSCVNSRCERLFEFYMSVHKTDLIAEVVSAHVRNLSFASPVRLEDAGSAALGFARKPEPPQPVPERPCPPAPLPDAHEPLQAPKTEELDVEVFAGYDREKLHAYFEEHLEQEEEWEEHVAFARRTNLFDLFIQKQISEGAETDFKEVWCDAEVSDPIEDIVAWYEFLGSEQAKHGSVAGAIEAMKAEQQMMACPVVEQPKSKAKVVKKRVIVPPGWDQKIVQAKEAGLLFDTSSWKELSERTEVLEEEERAKKAAKMADEAVPDPDALTMAPISQVKTDALFGRNPEHSGEPTSVPTPEVTPAAVQTLEHSNESKPTPEDTPAHVEPNAELGGGASALEVTPAAVQTLEHSDESKPTPEDTPAHVEPNAELGGGASALEVTPAAVQTLEHSDESKPTPEDTPAHVEPNAELRGGAPMSEDAPAAVAPKADDSLPTATKREPVAIGAQAMPQSQPSKPLLEQSGESRTAIAKRASTPEGPSPPTKRHRGKTRQSPMPRDALLAFVKVQSQAKSPAAPSQA